MHPSSRRRFRGARKRARIAAALCVAAAAWSGQPAWAQTAPTVSGRTISSNAGADSEYRTGDDIAVTVTFSAIVHVFEGEVGGVQRGQLHLLLTVGANTRQAQFCGGSGSAMLRFCYRVQTGDNDDDGVSIGNLATALVGGVIQSAAGVEVANRAFAALANQAAHMVDGVAPAVDSVRIVSSPAGGGTAYGFGEAIVVEVTFTETVSVIGNPEIIVTIGENSRRATYRSGSGTTALRFRHLVRADDQDDDGINIGPGTRADGSPLSFVGGTITDLAGNPANRRFNGLTADPMHTVDGGMDVDPPAVVSEGVAITSPPGNYAAGAFVVVTVTFDEPVHVTGNPTLALRVGAADRIAALVDGGNGRAELRFRYRVQPGEVDNDGIAIPANALALNGATIQDGAGNAATLFFPSPGRFSAYRVAAVAPFVRSVAFTSTPSDGAAYQVGESITAQVAFDDAGLVVVGAPTLALAIGNPPNRRMALQRAVGGILEFSYAVRAGDADMDGIDIPAGPDALAGGTLRDEAGNPADRGFGAVRSSHDVSGGADTTSPSVRGVAIASAPDDGNTYLSGERIAIAVTFDEPVQVTGAPTVPIVVGASTRNAVASAAEEVTRLLFHYDIQNGDADVNGVSVEAPAIVLGGATIQDRSGNNAVLTLRQLPDQPAHRVDATPPAIVGAPSITSAPTNSPAYGAGETIRVQLSFNEPVRVAGRRPTLALVVGANRRTMRYDQGGGTNALTFAYTVLAGEMDAGGVSVPANALSRNGGTMRDAVGNSAVLTHGALADDAGHQVNGGADAGPPSVMEVRVPGGPANVRGYFGYGDEIAVVVVFNEPVFVTGGGPALTFTIGGQERTAAYDGGGGTTDLTFRYRVDAIDDGAVVVPQGDLQPNGATLQDAAGNAAGTAQPGVDNTCCRADGAAPRVAMIALTSHAGIDNTYKRGEAIAVGVTFSEPICVDHAPSLTLGIRIGERTRRARLLETPNCNTDETLAFEYVVQQDDRDEDGIAIEPGALSGGAITDRADNRANVRRGALERQPSHRVDAATAGARVAIVSDPGADRTYSGGDVIRVQVTFDQQPTRPAGSHLLLTIGNLAREATLQEARGPRLTYVYQVQEGDRDADGISIGADALRGGTFADRTLVPVPNNANHRVDAVPPEAAAVTITSNAGSDDTYETDDVIEVEVRFNEIVFVEANPRLRLSVGTRTPAARYVGGSGTRTLRFAYNVQQGDNDEDGIAIGPNALIEGRIVDGFGNVLNTDGRRLRALPAQPAHKVASGVDSQAPIIVPDGVRVTSAPRVGAIYAIGEVVEVQVVFSEAVNVLEVGVVGGQQVELERPVLELELGCGQPVSRSARLASEDDASDTLTFRYTIAEGDCDGDGLSIPANALTGGTIVDYAEGENVALRRHGAVRTTQQVDAVRPSALRATISSRPRSGNSYGLGETISVRVRFNEEVYVTGQPTLRLGLGRESREALFAMVDGASLVFHYVVRAGDHDDDGVSIGPDALNGTIVDHVGNRWTQPRLPALPSQPGHEVGGDSDFLPPVVTSVRFSNAPPTGQDAYGLNDNIDVEVTFSENVFVVAGTPNVPISIGGDTRRAIYLTGDGGSTLIFRYLVQLGDHDPDGISIGPNAIFGGTLQDAAGNAAVLTFVGVPQDDARKVNPNADQQPPTVERVWVHPDAAGGVRTYGIGTVIELRVRFNERVVVSGQPVLALSVGANDRRATYANGSGTNELVFRYAVAAGDFDDDGIAIGPNALTGGAIEDFSGNAARRAFDALDLQFGHLVDARRPAATGVFFVSTGPYRLGQTIIADVHFNEDVYVTGAPVLNLAIGDASRPARYERGSGTRALRFAYQVRGGDFDDDGISIGPDALVGGVIEDRAGNNWGQAERRLPALGNQSAHTVDAGVGVNTEAPYVVHMGIISTPDRGAYRVDEPIDVQVWFSEPVWVNSAAAVRLRVGAALREAALHAGSGTDRLTFRYAVRAGDVARQGVSIGPLGTALTGTIVDESGNAAIADFSPVAASATHRVDAVRPSAQSVAIVSTPKVQDVYGLGEILRLRVTFNEEVWVEADTQGAEPALQLDVGRATMAARFVEGSGSRWLEFRYIVGTGDYDRDGVAVGADAIRGGVIRDRAGNEWSESERRVPALPAQSSHKINSGTDVDPAIVSGARITSAPARLSTYAAGAVIEAAITFTEVVHVSGTPSLALSIGPNVRQARYASGSGTNRLTFHYTVREGDWDEDGISVGPGPATLTGGAIRDDGGNAAMRDFAALPADGRHKVDAVPPTLTAPPVIVSTPAGGDTYVIGESIDVRIAFDETVEVSRDPVLALSIGSATREAAYQGTPRCAPASCALEFRHTVQEGDLDEDGVSVAANALRGGAITDAVGNPAVYTVPALGAQSEHKVDGVVATAALTIASRPETGDSYRADEHIEIHATFSEPIAAAQTAGLRLALTIGETVREAALLRIDTDQRTVAFRYTVSFGDFDADGVSVQGEALLGGGTVTDLAGNEVRRAMALTDQAGHKVNTSVTLALAEIALTVGGTPLDINLADVLAFAGLYQAPVSSDENVAVARISGHRLTITPVAEGNATITVTAASAAAIVLNIPVVVTASPAEVAVLTHTLAAMGRGMLASTAHTIGTRLELGPEQRRMSLLVGGRRFEPQDADAAPAWPNGIGADPFPPLDGMASDLGPWPGGTAAAAGTGALPGHSDVFGAAAPLGGGFGRRGEQWRGTSFEMPLLGVGRASAWSLWGGGDFAAFAGEPDENAYDGDLAAVYLGMDGRGQGWVAGGAVGRVSADATYEYKDANSAGKGSVETSLTTFHPYVGWSLGERAKAWAIVGFGRGEASMKRDGHQYVAEPTDLSMRMGLVGARGAFGDPGGFDVAVRADAGTLSLETDTGPKAIDALTVAVQRVRVGVELSYTADTGPVVGGVRLSGHSGGAGRFTPFVEVGARFDGGDGPSGTGAEMAVGARYESAAVSFEAKARTLAMHGAEGYTETGASATLVVAPGGSGGRGLRFSVSPRWGGASDATDVFFQRDYAAQAARRHNTGSAAYHEWRANARVEYGMALRGRAGTVTPFAETDVGGAGGNRARVGFAYQTKAAGGSPLRFDVSGERVKDARGTDHRLLVRAEARF